jgi:RNA-directed DNA polymerase
VDTKAEPPTWLFRPLPTNAALDQDLIAQVDQLAQGLPHSLRHLHNALNKVAMYREYDAAANRACAHVWLAVRAILTAHLSSDLLTFACAHMTEQARLRILRRLTADRSWSIRNRIRKLIRKGEVREVSLPADAESPWDATGWLPASPRRLQRHAQGRRIQERHGVPPIADLAALRALLGIRSERQLGYFLLATDEDNGPYSKFSIPKRDGRSRDICAPKPQLRWVQRLILDEILAKAPAHDAAHGFITGRSIVTNAAPHRGAEVIVKFDLEDFFPTIHHYRVLGLFARLGYSVGNSRFGTHDASNQVAPTLARLCSYTPEPRSWHAAVLPQGAPTSPAISNLVCRRLDARLTGLAARNGGVYTRYADDLTFSFRDGRFGVGRFRWWVDQVCQQEGFFINHSKFHVIRRSQRQVVTGIVVNDSLSIPREDRRRFRAILHNCEKHGIESQSRGDPVFAGYLRGFASYLHMVHPDEGAECLRRVSALLGNDGEEAR